MVIIKVDSEKLIQSRIKAGHTQRTLALASGTEPSLISRLEAGKINTRPQNAMKICTALGVDFEELFQIQQFSAS